MCSADITPVVQQWDTQEKRSWARLDVPHTCRDFEKIKDWALKWKLKVNVNPKEHVKDDWVYHTPEPKSDM